MSKGKFIVLEGPDSTGKTTISKKLAEWLNQTAQIDAVLTRHPGATPVGRALRQLILETEMDAHTRGLLFSADNSAFIHEILRPKVNAGSWIICDRNNFISSLAYQIADGVPLDELDNMHSAVLRKDTPKIDLLLVFRASYDNIKKRYDHRPEAEKHNKYEEKMASRAYFDKIMGAYERLMEEHPKRLLRFVEETSSGVAPSGTPRCLFIDANGSVDEVFAAVQEAVKTVIHEQVAAL